jgi:hypothetical protein
VDKDSKAAAAAAVAAAAAAVICGALSSSCGALPFYLCLYKSSLQVELRVDTDSRQAAVFHLP